jgi:FMN phosphatase YigB (HAD superfamily)
MTKPRYKAVLFDIDDTLLKTWVPKWRQHKWVAKHYYDINLSDETLRKHWGEPFDELAEVLYQGRGTREERRANFIRHELEFPKEWEPHALETIEALHEAGVALGLMTSMYWEGALVDLRNLRVPLDYFVGAARSRGYRIS